MTMPVSTFFAGFCNNLFVLSCCAVVAQATRDCLRWEEPQQLRRVLARIQPAVPFPPQTTQKPCRAILPQSQAGSRAASTAKILETSCLAFRRSDNLNIYVVVKQLVGSYVGAVQL